jgi:glucan phosphorylase
MTDPMADSYNIAIYLKESEIETMLDAIISRISDKEDLEKLKNFISHIIYQRRFSEEFLLKYIDYLPNKDTLLQMHRSEIKSGEYANIALLFEMEKI